MGEYISSVIGAAVLSGAASLLSPQTWRKYVGIVSGIVILCTIAAPLSRISIADIAADPRGEMRESEIRKGEKLRLDLIREELKERVERDIEERMRKEYGAAVKAEADIGVSSDGKITGVRSITVDGRISASAQARLCEVYGVEKITVR